MITRQFTLLQLDEQLKQIRLFLSYLSDVITASQIAR